MAAERYKQLMQELTNIIYQKINGENILNNVNKNCITDLFLH